MIIASEVYCQKSDYSLTAGTWISDTVQDWLFKILTPFSQNDPFSTSHMRSACYCCCWSVAEEVEAHKLPEVKHESKYKQVPCGLTASWCCRRRGFWDEACRECVGWRCGKITRCGATFACDARLPFIALGDKTARLPYSLRKQGMLRIRLCKPSSI